MHERHGQQSSSLMVTDSQDIGEDYCQQYAVLVEGLRKLLSEQEEQGPPDAEWQLELQNQTRAAVGHMC